MMVRPSPRAMGKAIGMSYIHNEEINDSSSICRSRHIPSRYSIIGLKETGTGNKREMGPAASYGGSNVPRCFNSR